MTDRVAMAVEFLIRAMTADDAQAVAAWRYDGPYAFYDWDRDPDDLAELLDPAQWGGRYFSADDADGELRASSWSRRPTAWPRSGSGCGRR